MIDLLNLILTLLFYLLHSLHIQPLLIDPTSTTKPASQASKATRYLDSVGPIESKVRIIDPSVVNGYSSCNDLKEDISNALKHYVSTIIASEIQYGAEWVVNADPAVCDNCRRLSDVVLSPYPFQLWKMWSKWPEQLVEHASRRCCSLRYRCCRNFRFQGHRYGYGCRRRWRVNQGR